MNTQRHKTNDRPAADARRRSLRRATATLWVLLVLFWSSTALGAISALLELPGSDFPASGIGNIQGWAYTNVPGAQIQRLIEVRIDDHPVFRVPCCASRADVQSVYPSAPVRTGFSGVYNFQGLTAGAHVVQLTIRSTASEQTTITRTFNVVKVAPYAFLKAFKWQMDGDGGCESLNGLDPAHGNAGAVCQDTRSFSSEPGSPYTSCNGTIQLAFDRGTQTFAPIVGCDPGSNRLIVRADGSGEFVCLPNAIYSLSVDAGNLSPTFSFATAYKAESMVEIWENGKSSSDLAAFGVGGRTTRHALKPYPLVNDIKSGRTYSYRITVKSICPQIRPDVVETGSFTTLRRVARAYIDKAYIIEDGDSGNVKGPGEIRFGLSFRHPSLPYDPSIGSGYKGTSSEQMELHYGTTVHAPISLGWAGAAESFDLVARVSERGALDDLISIERKFSFDQTLTTAGGTFTKSFTLTESNLSVKLWLRVAVTYE